MPAWALGPLLQPPAPSYRHQPEPDCIQKPPNRVQRSSSEIKGVPVPQAVASRSAASTSTGTFTGHRCDSC